MSKDPLVAIYIVTFRRHAMLRRALASALGQTHGNIVVKVVNDDPSDEIVQKIVNETLDPRASLFWPIEKRGPVRNFNLIFKETGADFVTLLEDDNWWEPAFLTEMMRALQNYPDAPMIVGNERLWQELPGNRWRDTGKTIWDFNDVRVHNYEIEEICGSAKLCNSSMLIRTGRARELLVPESILVDVSEHFRERTLQGFVLLHGAALTNFAVTLQTARVTRSEMWGVYQCLLIGSVFIAVTDARLRRALAIRLWANCRSRSSPRAVSLLMTGWAILEARPLVWRAPLLSFVRFALWLTKKPGRALTMKRIRDRHSIELAFLVNAPLTRHCVRILEQSHRSCADRPSA